MPPVLIKKAVVKSPFSESDLAAARSIAHLHGEEEQAYMESKRIQGIAYDDVFSPSDARALIEAHEEYVSGSRKRLGA